MSKEALLIRADASVSIGTGHIMRMIALGQARGKKILVTLGGAPILIVSPLK